MKTKAPYWQRVLHEIVQSPNGLTARQLHETFGSSHESSVSESLLRLFRDGRIVREKSVDKRTYRYFIPVMQPSVSNEDMLSVESSTTSSDEHLQPEEEMQLAEDSTIESFQSEIDGLETDEEDKPYPEPARSRRKRLRACFTKLAKGHLVPGYDGSDASLWTLAGFPAGSRISNAVVDELRSSVERKLSAPISRELPSPGSASTDSDSLLLPSFLEGTVRAPTDTVISSFRVLATSSSRSSDQKILKPEASAQLAQRTWSAPEERPTKKPRFDGPELPVATSKGTQSQEKPDKNTTKIVQHPLPPTWKSNPLDEVLGSISRLISDAREPPLNAPLTIQRHSSLSSELGEKMNGQKCMSRRPSTPPRKSDSSVPEVPQIPGRQTRVKFADPCVIEAPKMSTLRPSAPKKSILKKTPSSTGYLGTRAISFYGTQTLGNSHRGSNDNDPVPLTEESWAGRILNIGIVTGTSKPFEEQYHVFGKRPSTMPQISIPEELLNGTLRCRRTEKLELHNFQAADVLFWLYPGKNEAVGPSNVEEDVERRNLHRWVLWLGCNNKCAVVDISSHRFFYLVPYPPPEGSQLLWTNHVDNRVKGGWELAVVWSNRKESTSIMATYNDSATTVHACEPSGTPSALSDSVELSSV
eukprot:CAMPEP_0184646436 /NCGR_PEP_ID=MMETSP0308-20130426/3142_1 /TAXON_ID=38269 /ORGANISM="Gloeochaete witrockiana, Strain SAG 46.84" /LENGTH=641 /DNA_ID=CAMNT_0027076453 /DNA_START=89 /DNA_END=2014 /DNA_ORIENTATION=+